MYIIIPFESFQPNNVFFGKRQTNNMVSYCYFTNVMYSTPNYSMTNIMFRINIQPQSIKITNEMMYISFDTNYTKHKDLTSHISSLETQILKLYRGTKDNVYNQENITNQLMKGVLKLHLSAVLKSTYENYNENNLNVLLRISGIWENEYSKVGLIYKFILPNKQNQESNDHHTYIPEYIH